jgi:phenylacetate-CoA ligase
MAIPDRQYHSSIPGVSWPAIPGQEASMLLALQFQLERTQWLAPERLLELQFRQLDGLMRHAWETVPYYRERWRGAYDPGIPLTPERFSSLPFLTRNDLRGQFDALRSTAIPPAHGGTGESRTSGSTGSPVRVLKTGLCELWWRAFTLRDHAWHRRDLGSKLAAIRQGVEDGESAGWGPATDGIYVTGPCALLHVRSDVDAQLAWLERQQPQYLLTYPSNLSELARRAAAQGVKLPALREARTIGEVLGAETRELCRRAWDIPVTDAYSSDEVGYYALQCPAHEHYHVQAEGVLLEVLDERNRPCPPGAVGRVVVTSLHNFAMPLVRYDLQDYAEAGAPCPCGRGLPVLKRVMGRVRNMLRLRSGQTFWPMLGTRGLSDITPIMQQQIVQKSYDSLEVRLVVARKLEVAEEEKLLGLLRSRFPPDFSLELVYRDSIARGAGGKFEEFLSELPASAG